MGQSISLMIRMAYVITSNLLEKFKVLLRACERRLMMESSLN